MSKRSEDPGSVSHVSSGARFRVKPTPGDGFGGRNVGLFRPRGGDWDGDGMGWDVKGEGGREGG